MAAGVSPDFASQLTVSFKAPPAGSCITQAFLNELASLLVITQGPANVQGGTCVSVQANNLISLDAENCVFAPGVDRFEDQQDLLFSAPADLTFNGWPASIDATVAQMTITPLLSPADFGVASVDVVSRAADKVVIRVTGATANATVQFQLVQNPVPPVQS